MAPSAPRRWPAPSPPSSIAARGTRLPDAPGGAELLAIERLAEFGTFVLDIDSGRLTRSAGMSRLLGLDAADADSTLEAFLARVHRDDRRLVHHLLADSVREGTPFSCEHRIVLDDGMLRLVKQHGELVRDAQGRVARMVCTARDITGRRLAAALASGQRLVLEMVATGALIEDVLLAIASLVEEQCPGLASVILLVEEDGAHLRVRAAPSLPRACVEELDGRRVGAEAGSSGLAAERGQPVYTPDVAADPVWEGLRAPYLEHGLRSCWSAPILSGAGVVLGTFSMFGREARGPSPANLQMMEMATHLARVAIEHERTRQELHTNEARFRRLSRATNDVVYDTDLVHGLTWRTDVGKLLGVPGDEVEPTLDGWLRRMHPDDRTRVHAELDAALEKLDELWSSEYRLRRGDGAWVYVLDRAYIRYSPGGEPLRITGSIADISARREVEEEVRRSREQLRLLAAYLQQVREEERRRIAREIHDELGQALTAIKMDVAWMQRQVSSHDAAADVEARLRATTALVDDTIATVRRISKELRPGVLDTLGLPDAVEWQLQEMEARTGVKGRFTCTLGDEPLPEEISTNVFRIVQEALTNVVRHARASHVSVALELDGGTLRAEVADDGCGITEQQSSGLGLLGMRERALLLGGTLLIHGVPGRGTRVAVAIPLQRDKVNHDDQDPDR